MDKTHKNEKTSKNNGKLSFYPLKFEHAIRDLLKVKPEKDTETQDDKTTKVK